MEKGGKIYFNHGSKHSKGVAILFDPKLTVSVKKEIKSDDGRIIILETNIDDEITVLVHIYALNNIHARLTTVIHLLFSICTEVSDKATRFLGCFLIYLLPKHYYEQSGQKN